MSKTIDQRQTLYAEVTAHVIAELEQGRLSLSIQPTVRHADYIGSWLEVLRHDDKAIFRAASAASKAADYLLGFAADAYFAQAELDRPFRR